jgi:putative transposase
MAASGAALVVRAPQTRSNICWCAWPPRIGIGLPENPGSVGQLGREVARGTIANMLKDQGMEPAPERNRKTTWKEFLSRHRELTVAANFFTIEAWSRQGLTRFIVLFLIDLSRREVEIVGIARQANGLWMSQVARNLSDATNDFLVGKRYLIHDRGPLFTAKFLEILEASGVQSVKLPPAHRT